MSTFDNNSACIQGQDIYGYSLSRCKLAEILPSSLLESHNLYAPIHKYASYTNDGRNPRRSMTTATNVATGPNYLLMHGASCQCVKTVRDRWWLAESCMAPMAKTL